MHPHRDAAKHMADHGKTSRHDFAHPAPLAVDLMPNRRLGHLLWHPGSHLASDSPNDAQRMSWHTVLSISTVCWHP